MNDERRLDEAILASFERGEWAPARDQKRTMTKLQAAAAAALLKNRRVDRRLSARSRKRPAG